MRRNNKQLTTTFILCSLLLIGVIYAILQANLQINGTAKIQANTWDIHFDNIQVNENSVSIGAGDSAATIDPENNCKVDFEVTLSLPGDFYEFTIDVVNSGTIDGMIGELNKTLKVNNETVSETPNYLDYSVTYSDGVEIEQNHKINAGTTETYLVRLEFKTDIEELPQAATITTSLEPQYLQADSTAIKRAHLLYDVFKGEVDNNSGLVHEYTDEHKDSFSRVGTKKIYHWYATNNTNADTILDKWNVIFGGFCWQMIRTTDTGGIKLIYNGIPNNGKCNNTGEDQQIGKSQFNSNDNSLGLIGYMYNSSSLLYSISGSPASGSIFGYDVDYSNGVYTLVDTSTSSDGHHYTCNSTEETCTTVRFYHYMGYYITLANGMKAEDAFEGMISSNDVNHDNSTIKTYIDSWYQNNLIQYSDKLEETIFCFNRSISDYGNWDKNTNLSYNQVSFIGTTSILCSNITDQFSTSTSLAKLDYSVGLMTRLEMLLLHHKKLVISGEDYWAFHPVEYSSYFSRIRGVSSNDDLSYNGGTRPTASYEVRPAVSLKPGTTCQLGDGSKDNPFIIE